MSHSANEALNRTLLALADPTRRALLHRLAEGDARVTDLSAPFDMSLAAVSKHIRVLERAASCGAASGAASISWRSTAAACARQRNGSQHSAACGSGGSTRSNTCW
jgi:hypothetical protein